MGNLPFAHGRRRACVAFRIKCPDTISLAVVGQGKLPMVPHKANRNIP